MDIWHTVCLFVILLGLVHKTWGECLSPVDSCDVTIDYASRYQCYNHDDASDCCNTCEKFQLGQPGCEYGDRTPGDCFFLPRHTCYNQTGDDCCRTCALMARDSQGCEFGDRDPSLCFQSMDRHQCYDAEVGSTCCETCEEIKDTEAGEDCMYGDHDPDLCWNFYTRDCYNDTFASECCASCLDLRDDSYPDCLYGDHSDECYDIERRDCYDIEVRRKCCGTCADMANPSHTGCEYGNTEDNCDRYVGGDCLADDELAGDCCETCQYYQDKGCVNAENASCFTISPHMCYNDRVSSECCQTCHAYHDATKPENCRYGDRDIDACMDVFKEDCYNATNRRMCCQTCADYADTGRPDCEYGDWTFDGCFISGHDCYDPDLARQCCSSCQDFYDISDDYGQGCRYGDRLGDECYSLSRADCYDPGTRFNCCRQCIDMAETDALQGCEWGSVGDDCYLIEARDCYNRSRDCCEQCPHMAIDIAGCRFGNRADSCSDLHPGQCYDPGTRHECCDTCFHLEDPAQPDNCRFGDRYDNCSVIAAAECYEAATRFQCCDRCPGLENSKLPDSCLYGDRTQSCANIVRVDCYFGATEFQCCETCFRFEDPTKPACRHGDKEDYCTTIERASCYDDSTRMDCCDSCSAMRNTSWPGCEYGDEERFCDTAECPEYDASELQACCSTCRYFIPTTTTTTTTTSSTTSTTSTTIRTTRTTTQSSSSRRPGTTAAGPEKQSDTQSWVTPVAVGVPVGLVVIAIVVLAIMCYIRRSGRKSESFRNSSPPSHYALDPRPQQLAPAATYQTNPNRSRAQPPTGSLKKTQEEENVYAYINPDDVKSILSEEAVSSPTHKGGPAKYQAPGTNSSVYHIANGGASNFHDVTNPAYVADSSLQGEKPDHSYAILEPNPQTREHQYGRMS